MLSWLDRTFPGTVRQFDTSISTFGGYQGGGLWAALILVRTGSSAASPPLSWRHIDGADHALDDLMARVDGHLDRLFLFGWFRAKSDAYTTGAGAHRARVHLAVEAISCPNRGRV